MQYTLAVAFLPYSPEELICLLEEAKDECVDVSRIYEGLCRAFPLHRPGRMGRFSVGVRCTHKIRFVMFPILRLP